MCQFICSASFFQIYLSFNSNSQMSIILSFIARFIISLKWNFFEIFVIDRNRKVKVHKIIEQ